jgi:predicted Rossmann fold nucleotide-binding protein DprA/Smf involved in DNA uptake
MSYFKISAGQLTQARVFSVVRSYPEGITAERIASYFGWRVEAIRGAAIALEAEGKIKRDDAGSYKRLNLTP